jgi:hypothetical protein
MDDIFGYRKDDGGIVLVMPEARARQLYVLSGMNVTIPNALIAAYPSDLVESKAVRSLLHALQAGLSRTELPNLQCNMRLFQARPPDAEPPGPPPLTVVAGRAIDDD